MAGTTDRIATLDLIRGVAVMGILVANLPGFALPADAYFSPLPWGGSGAAQRIAWALNYILVEGKMRGLFSFLFGASMLLVVERAGEDAASVHYRRMFWLFAIGLAHLYLLWWGDILAHYALVGSVAFLFARLSPRGLLIAGAVCVGVQVVLAWAPALVAFQGGPQATAMLRAFGGPDPAGVTREVVAMRGSFADALRWRAGHNVDPLAFALFTGPETLGYMLGGMAGLKSGFLTGSWERRRYRRIAAWAIPIGWAAYSALAANTLRHGFDPRHVLLGSIALAVPLRPLLIVGYASAVMLLARPGGWLTERIAAAGRVAFTNYLGTTVVMTAVFQGWGLGLFGRVDRASMYLLVPIAWAIMLLWSKPWLGRYRYGPLEWLWRSLARLEWQPIRLRPARRS